MPTKRTPRQADIRATHVRFGDTSLYVTLADGREVGVPLARLPRLATASAAQRAHWHLTGQGVGIHWPDVDEDLSVPRLLGLLCA